MSALALVVKKPVSIKRDERLTVMSYVRPAVRKMLTEITDYYGAPSMSRLIEGMIELHYEQMLVEQYAAKGIVVKRVHTYRSASTGT